MPDQTASGDASRLEPGWRDRIAADVVALATAWRDPAAWTGMTKAGPVEMPGEVGGLVALDELVVHGWDLAVATGQAFTAGDEDLEAAKVFLAMLSGPGTEEMRGDAFGPERDVDRLGSAPHARAGDGRTRRRLARLTPRLSGRSQRISYGRACRPAGRPRRCRAGGSS